MIDTTKPLTIGIVAGEISGDMLGADFMAKMNAIHPNITWVGVGGVQMTAQGLSSVIDMSRLSVMGLVEVVKHLPDLLHAKRQIMNAFLTVGIDIFVGIDAPDFNLRLGKALKPKGVFCVQYVSPSVWAWRENRIHAIKKATDLVLCLFPFELDVYKKHHHPAVCVGHPLLDKLHADTRLNDEIFKEFVCHVGKDFPTLQNIDNQKQPICVMAGSRNGEIQAILPLLIQSMQHLDESGKFAFILPVVNQAHASLVGDMIHTQAPTLVPHCHIIFPKTDTQDTAMSLFQKAMNACRLVILASGTATLEALLLHRPMVVVYKVNATTYAIAKRLIKIPFVSLPNILSHHQTGKDIVPELIQERATAQTVMHHALKLLSTPNLTELANTTQRLRKDSRANPAETVLSAYLSK